VAQLFRPAADTIARIILFSLVLLPIAGVALAYTVRVSPYWTQQNVTLDQPVPFSHKHHVGDLGLDCRYCHAGVETGRFAGMPPSSTCMTCHSQIWTNAAMLAPVRESFAHKTPIRWNRVHRLADYVYFDHSIHVAKGVPCSACHGAVHEMALMRQAEPLTMGWCLDCHRNPGPHLVRASEEYNTAWTAHDEPLSAAREYVGHYNIKAAHLTDCSTCHR
jgi:hypothetical protein